MDDQIMTQTADHIATDSVAALKARRSVEDHPVKLEVKNLNFFYANGHQALTDINLSLREKAVTAFIGPSGCGKSTLLRTLNRMYDLYPGQRAEGEVLLDGRNTLSPKEDLNVLRAKVGMVFQKPTPFPMSIHENIAFGIRLYEKLSKAEMTNRVEAALREAALWDEVADELHSSALDLSAGEQQRLCIARAAATEPEVLLMDEPSIGLAPKLFQDLLAPIRALQLQEGLSILLVEQNVREALKISDRAAVMKSGRMIWQGRPEALSDNRKLMELY